MKVFFAILVIKFGDFKKKGIPNNRLHLYRYGIVAVSGIGVRWFSLFFFGLRQYLLLDKRKSASHFLLFINARIEVGGRLKSYYYEI